MRYVSAMLPFHNPIIKTHKRNRSPPLAGSTSRASDPFSAQIGLGLSTTTLDDSACANASNVVGGVKPRNPKETCRSRWNWHLRAPVHGSKRLAIKNHFIACLGEFVGSVLFLFLALGSASVANLMATSVTGTAAASGKGAAPNTSSLFFIATGAGLALTVTTFTFARVSGALFNPAVSLGMALVGALGPLRALLLIVVQIVGGIVAAALVNALTPGSRNYATTLGPTMTVARGLFLEMMLTMILMLTILFLVAEKHKGTLLAPVGIGLAFFVAELYGVFWTGGSLNPARSLGPAIVLHSFPSYFWIYMLGPCLGAVLAAAFYKTLKYLEYETVIPPSPDTSRISLRASGNAGAHTVPIQGPGLGDLLTREAPTLTTAAALRQHTGGSGMRNSQLQERFDRLEEIIEQLGAREPGSSTDPTREREVPYFVDDETSRGKWCNPRGSHILEGLHPPVSAPTSEKAEYAETSSQLIDNLTPLHSTVDLHQLPEAEPATRKQQ